MSPEERKQIIVETISHHENIGSNELYTKIISERGNIFSKPTYLKDLKDLEEEHRISAVREPERQGVVITTWSNAQQEIDSFIKEIERSMVHIENYLNLMEKNVNQMSDDEKVDYFVTLVGYIQYQDWVISCVTAFKNTQQVKLFTRLHALRDRVRHLLEICSPANNPAKIFGLVNNSLSEDSVRSFALDHSELKKKFLDEKKINLNSNKKRL
jgi:hypothetical protein